MMLDEALRAHGVERVDVMKVDVEMHECQVLAGARSLFASTSAPRFVMIETQFGNASRCVNALARRRGYMTRPSPTNADNTEMRSLRGPR